MPGKEIKYKMYSQLVDECKEMTEKKTQEIMRTNINSVEIDTGLKLKRIEGLVNGEPTYASTFIFEQPKPDPFFAMRAKVWAGR